MVNPWPWDGQEICTGSPHHHPVAGSSRREKLRNERESNKSNKEEEGDQIEEIPMQPLLPILESNKKKEDKITRGITTTKRNFFEVDPIPD